MVRSAREVFDEGQAAGRLRVPVAAWRWATGSGLVPVADVGPGRWSRQVVEAADPEAVRAALRGIEAGVAADRLTEALGVPLPILRPRVTASAVGHLVRAGLLVYLGGDPQFPVVHPDQVAALARRRDLPALLDRHVPLGPDQAAVRLGVRRSDFDRVVRLGWLAPVATVEVDFKRQGGVTTVPLYDAQEIALLEVVRPFVDWRAVRTARAGRRSPLAALDPSPGWEQVLLAEVARIARVGRAAVVNWRRRHDDFPDPVAGADVHPQFDRRAVVAWLLAHDKIEVPTGPTIATLVLAAAGGASHRFRLDDPWLHLADDAGGEDTLSGWSTDDDADAIAALAAGEFGASLRRLTAPGAGPLAVPGEVRVIDRFRSGSGGLRLALAWPAGLRGTAAPRPAGGVVRHGVAYAGAGEACVCARHDCGGVVPVSWCAEHGDAVGPVLEWHPGGGIRCTDLSRRADG
ncbi:hypothetical protein NRK68_36440 (plasmid) [Streptomyces yangpuensis]|uniref:Helicase XPB/Ssl2 N-terminal domain-containing protein n=1 Tax=Streptomyces yangpuensis TaxID=1648182 RepID=A0ABY5Q8G7_9ACTN|nr:hypothetical protein [Streptomyces yangpuensis]UUY52746.1 hypothetical protein NRK68_36440 [Streptomyces yangpuensis]